MGQRELTLTDPAIVGFKDLQSEAFGCPKPWANALKGVSKIAITTQAMVFGHAQVQDHQLVALTGVFDRPQVGRFDPNGMIWAVYTTWPGLGTGPYLDDPTPIHPLNCQICKA